MIVVKFKPTPFTRQVERLLWLLRLRTLTVAAAYYQACSAQARAGTAWARRRGLLDKYGAHFAQQAVEAAEGLAWAHAQQAVAKSILGRAI